MAAPFPATIQFHRQAADISVFYQPRIIINPANTHIPAGNKASPSPVHPLTTEACLLGLLGYYLAFTASLRWPQYATKLSVAMAAFGSFSSASLEITAAKLRKDQNASFATETRGSEGAQ